MKYIPLDCQEEGTDFILSNDGSGVIFRPGIGKTITTLTAIEELMYNYVTVKRVLVVAPKRVATMTWPDEIEKWRHTRGLTYTVLHGKDKLKRLMYEAPKVDLTIINYEGLRWLWNNKDYASRYDMIVFDESTYLKNGTSGRTKLAQDISRGIPRVVILTGTPKPNGIENLWSQIFMLDRGQRLGLNITSFRNEYMIPQASEIRKKRLPKAGAKKAVLDKVKDIVLVVEDTKGVGLPPVKDNIINIELTDKARKVYSKLENDWVATVDGEEVTVKNMQAQTQKLRQLAAGFLYTEEGSKLVHKEKLDAMKSLTDDLNGNALVGIQFKYEVDMIREHYGYRVPAIYSPTINSEGTKWIREWMNGDIPMLLAHPASMAHGLNLQGGGQDIIWFSLTWDLEYYLQLIGRLRRRGSQYDTVFNHILRSKDTIDDLLLKIVSEKDLEQEKALEYLKEWRQNLCKK